MENIRINPDGNYLSCKKIAKINKCTVTKEHFKDKSGGYYYINHKNSASKYTENLKIVKLLDLRLFYLVEVEMEVIMVMLAHLINIYLFGLLYMVYLFYNQT